MENGVRPIKFIALLIESKARADGPIRGSFLKITRCDVLGTCHISSRYSTATAF